MTKITNSDAIQNQPSNITSESTWADQLFFVVLYACLGFCLSYLGLFGRSAFQIPFFVLCLFVALRIVLRPKTREKIYEQLYSKQSIFLFVFFLVLLSYSIVGNWDGHSRSRLFGKPAVVALGFLLLGFSWSSRDTIDDGKVARGLMIGSIFGLVCVFVISTWNHLMGPPVSSTDMSNVVKISVYALNDELKILSILVFFMAAGQPTQRQIYVYAVLFSLAVFFLSFYTMGLYKVGLNTFYLRHSSSETVQIGIPIALAVLLCASVAPRFTTHIVFLGIATVLVSAPWLFPIWYYWAQTLGLPLARKFLVRAEIWDEISRIALQKPFFGHGLDATRYMGEIDFAQKYFKSREATHPHNMFVQIWLDMGVVGVFMALTVLYFAWQGVHRISIDKRPLVLAGIAMYSLFALVTHSVWQTWNMILLIMMFVLGSIYANEIDKKISTG